MFDGLLIVNYSSIWVKKKILSFSTDLTSLRYICTYYCLASRRYTYTPNLVVKAVREPYIVVLIFIYGSYGFNCDVLFAVKKKHESFTTVGSYAAYIGSCLPTFRDNIDCIFKSQAVTF